MCELDRFNNNCHNNEAGSHASEAKVQRILMTPLATGVGRVSKERWAAQFVLALKHFADALARPQRWKSLNWGDMEEAIAVEATWNL